MTRMLSALCLLAAVLAAGAGGYLWWVDRAAGPGAEADPGPVLVLPDGDVGEVPVGIGRTVEFTITNTGRVGRRVLGASGICNEVGCALPLGVDVTPVGPGGMYTLRCDLRVFHPGPFEIPVEVVVDDGGTRSHTLTVRGTGVTVPGGPPDGTPAP